MDSKQLYLQLDISCNHAGPLVIAVTSASRGHLGTKKSPKHSRYFHNSSSVLELWYSRDIPTDLKKTYTPL